MLTKEVLHDLDSRSGDDRRRVRALQPSCKLRQVVVHPRGQRATFAASRVAQTARQSAPTGRAEAALPTGPRRVAGELRNGVEGPVRLVLVGPASVIVGP